MLKKWIAPFALLASVGTATACEIQNNLESTAPANRFTLNADGTAVDNLTQLMWARCAHGTEWDQEAQGCPEVGSGFTVWYDAVDVANNSTYAGFDDWRLPNIKELVSIMEVACSRPAINTTVFPGSRVTSTYWSSTPDQYHQSNVWTVDHLGGVGAANRDYDTGHVILVRDPR